jgi:quercetin dioxygenase-like cupin family protein
MRGILLPAILLAFVTTAVAAQEPELPLRDEGPADHITYPPGSIEWFDGPASLPPGVRMSVLEGHPSDPGVFTMRLIFPDGYVIPPHWHPNVERVTVIEGRFLLGAGEEVDPVAAETLLPGSYTVMPPGMRHFAISEGETVIQITTVGPWEINYVRPEDDPREQP